MNVREVLDNLFGDFRRDEADLLQVKSDSELSSDISEGLYPESDCASVQNKEKEKESTILLIVNGQPKTKNRDGLRKAKTYSSIFSAMADMSKIQAQRRSERDLSKQHLLLLSESKSVEERLSSNREDDQKEVLSMEELNVLMDYMRELLKSNYKKSSYDRDRSRTDESIAMNVKRFNIANKEMIDKIPSSKGPFMDSIPGNPGEDYPIFSSVPNTSFSCQDQNYAGFYADVETFCQAFYICQEGGFVDGFLCPNGTVFNQEYFICDWWFNVNCDIAEMFFPLNEFVYNSTSIF
ncbi:unnamed protein product [Lepeophtheirus salmonis]|uniref:(salmon louse) hypothetical protein n=1 Tax=Lepeophtheirus salmonis TaxID=72036 RepID=A0A7R8CEN8_LEPSM|nr:unnamed protein product [Lepeophtheirus salmonis]CAF2797325.1 unnamed protein product [Lepeophtheirus salmonis]